MATKSSTKQREVTVLARYEIKQDYAPKGLKAGDVVLWVENDKGVRYYTTLRRNKVHSCQCAGNAEHGKRCYHIKAMVQAENARAAAVAMPPKCPFAFRVGDRVVRGATAAEALLRALAVVKQAKVVEELQRAA